MKRREFLVGSAALASVRLQAQSNQGSGSSEAKYKKVCISSWSFHDLFKTTRDENSPALIGAGFDVMTFPEMLADKYKVHNMEVVAPHFASTDTAYLADFRKRLDQAHSRLVNIPVDIQELGMGGGLSDPDEHVRTTAIEASKKWIDVAATLRAESVRCDPGKMQASNLALTASSYKKLGDYASSKKIRVLIENHGGVGSEHPEELVEVFRRAGSNVGALPDFGNFPDQPTRTRGLKLLFPYASSVCHVKDPRLGADWKGGEFDFAGCVATSKKAGYRGVYSLEAEFGGEPYTSVRRLLDELITTL